MSDKYILLGHTPIVVDDLMTWAKWFEKAERRVAKTDISENVHVSTVFLGLDHSFGEVGPPMLFETMVFGGPRDGDTWRYATWDEAVAGHSRVINELKGE